MRRVFGHIDDLGGGRWRVWWTANGERHSKRLRGTRKDAELLLARMQLESGAGIGDCTLSDYWTAGVVPTFGNLSERTAYDYARLWRVELEPLVGHLLLSRVTWRNAEQGLARISSPIVQRDAYKLLRKILNMAVRDGLIDRNPISQGVTLKPYRKSDKALYDRAAVERVILGAVPFKHYPLVLMELGGGLRHEEACAVTRSDVSRLEWRGRVYAAVSVSKALTSVDSKKVLKEPKTPLSGRLVVLGDPFALPLLGVSSRLPEDAREQSSPLTITRNWKRFATNNGVPHIPFANMRTNYSVLHAEAGSVDSLVSLSMGHTDGTTRGRNYMEQTRAGLCLIADNLADYLLR